MPCRETQIVEQEVAKPDIALELNASGIKSVILGAQKDEIMYSDLKRMANEARCNGCIAWFSDKHVSYYGQNEETHIEYILN